MNRNKEFLKNTVILLIGKFATQFMSLLLLPLFTHFLLAEDYGTVDLFQTYITLFVPILTFRIDSAVFRFLIDQRKNEDGKKQIISNIIFLMLSGILLTIVICLIMFSFVKIKYLPYVIINLFILMISNVLLQVLRGLGKNKEYSIASILAGFVTLVVNLILILGFKMGAETILIASSLANIVCILYVMIKIKLPKYFKKNYIKKKDIKEILKYSLPMIPNALSWWIVNVSDRTIISFFLGVAYNGIYSVSCKFSNIMNSIFSIFNVSWQETASLHIKDKDKDEFFSDITDKILYFFGTISLLIIACLPFVYNILIGVNYVTAYNYIPILLFANLGNVFSGLIGGIYIALKKTKEIANTTIISAIINIVINLALIKFIGLYAAAISTLISYIAISVYRYVDSRKYIKIKFNFFKLIKFTIIFIICSYLYILNNFYLNLVNFFFTILYCYLLNKALLKILWKKINQKIKIPHISLN